MMQILTPFCETHIESTPPVGEVTESTTTRTSQQQGTALMKRTTKYVALDVHQASTVSSVREEGGRVIARTIVPTEASAIVEFFRGMRGTIHVTFGRFPALGTQEP